LANNTIHHHNDRLWGGVQPVEDRAFRRGKGFVAHTANVPLILLAMDGNISFSGLTTCRAGDIRAKYLVGVIGSSPGLVTKRVCH
jgi:hypothetical protein